MVAETIINFGLTAFFIWGLFNEPKLAKLEQKLFKKLRRK